MHSKFDKMRFQRMNENNVCDSQDVRDDENHNHPLQDSSEMLTIEGLRRTYNSCSNCGVCWYDDHISLDCSECGGYAMCRPCPMCKGQCGNMWRRDVKASHVNKLAQWHGSCTASCQTSQNLSESLTREDSNANFHSCYHSTKIAS